MLLDALRWFDVVDLRVASLRAWPWAQSDTNRGRPSSRDVLLMWKLLIVGKNYGNLSDEKLEEFGKSLPRVIRFAGTRLGFGPDAKTIHKYRSALVESGVMDELFAVLTKQRQKDLAASWTKKGTKSYDGYQRHVSVSTEHKLIYSSAVTPAHVHDIQRAKTVLEKIPQGSVINSVYGMISHAAPRGRKISF